MATTDQQTRSTSRQSADADRNGATAWPTRDLDRRGSRQPEGAEQTGERVADQMTSAGEMAEPTPAETTMNTPTANEPAARPAASRASSFLADLTRAMRIAAEEERTEVLARFRQDAEAFVESTRGEFAAAADVCRQRCDTDVASIEAWCEAELERIRRETEQGIVERRERLEAELAAQSARLDDGVARVGSTVESFERDMATFFERLLVEEDPSTFAVMARQLPEPPAFAPWPPEATPESESWTASRMIRPALDLDALAAAEAEAAAGLETEGVAVGPTVTPAAMAAPPAVPAPAGTDAEATRMVVAALGLVSVASVSSFKRALAHTAGVRSVQVSSGPQGEFLFNLSCDPGLDLAALVCALPGFEVEVRDAAPDAVQIVARDLEAEG
jgi:hypothetical protein